MRLPLRTLAFAAKLCCALSVLVPVSASATGPGPETHLLSGVFTDDIRVRLTAHERLASIRLESTRGSIRVMDGSDTQKEITRGHAVTIERDGSGLRVLSDGQAFRVSHVTLTALEGLRLPDSDASYAGALEVSAGGSSRGFTIVNVVPIEEYVASVVGSEYGLPDQEGAKAMAIAARTYALYSLSEGRSSSSLLDDERSQMYRGLERATSAARKAAQETAGMVLTREGSLVETVYSASNGGITASNESIWGTSPEAHLRSKKDPWDRISPHSSWTFSLKEDRLHDMLSSKYGFEVRKVDFDDPGQDGRIGAVRLKGRSKEQVLSGTTFRALVASRFGDKSLRSTYFKVDSRGGSYHFEGHGFGHGVGLSQWGAHAMALDGRSFRDILDFYYSGARLEQLYPAEESVDIRLELPVLAQSTRVDPPSLNQISDDFSTPQEKKSTSVKKNSGPELTARNVWGKVTREDSAQKPRKARAGW